MCLCMSYVWIHVMWRCLMSEFRVQRFSVQEAAAPWGCRSDGSFSPLSLNRSWEDSDTRWTEEAATSWLNWLNNTIFRGWLAYYFSEKLVGETSVQRVIYWGTFLYLISIFHHQEALTACSWHGRRNFVTNTKALPHQWDKLLSNLGGTISCTNCTEPVQPVSGLFTESPG